MDKETKQMFELILTKLDSMEEKQDSMDKRHDEMYIMQRGLEEHAKVTRAEQEKIMYILSDIQGKVTKLTNKVEDHENFISQIRAMK